MRMSTECTSACSSSPSSFSSSRILSRRAMSTCFRPHCSECATSEPRLRTSRRWLMQMRNWEVRRKRAISSRITVTAMRSASRRFAIWVLTLKSPDSKVWERFRLMNSPISSVPTCGWSRLHCIKPIRCRSCWNIIWVRTRWSARTSSSKIW